jgi:glycosyltransferase involved in cell wall biosynthesis
MSEPAVSVIMGVHNGAPWVGLAVASVLAQCGPAFELIVVDDGSTDATAQVLAAVPDPRLRVQRQPRAGLTAALTRALGLARAPLVARLDADDLAMPGRLARQAEFLDSHPEVGLLGSAAVEVDASGAPVRTIRPPVDDPTIRRTLIRRNPFVHSSIVMRRELVERAGGYDLAFPVAQDYDLWLRLSEITRLANLAEPLVTRRLLPGRVSLERDQDRLRAEARARWRAVRRGAYPAWCALFAVRPLLALAAPPVVRRFIRGGRPR